MKKGKVIYTCNYSGEIYPYFSHHYIDKHAAWLTLNINATTIAISSRCRSPPLVLFFLLQDPYLISKFLIFWIFSSIPPRVNNRRDLLLILLMYVLGIFIGQVATYITNEIHKSASFNHALICISLNYVTTVFLNMSHNCSEFNHHTVLLICSICQSIQFFCRWLLFTFAGVIPKMTDCILRVYKNISSNRTNILGLRKKIWWKTAWLDIRWPAVQSLGLEGFFPFLSLFCSTLSL